MLRILLKLGLEIYGFLYIQLSDSWPVFSQLSAVPNHPKKPGYTIITYLFSLYFRNGVTLLYQIRVLCHMFLPLVCSQAMNRTNRHDPFPDNNVHIQARQKIRRRYSLR